MSDYKMESAIRDYSQRLATKNKIGWLPLQLYDMLEENLPHGLVIELGEIILRNKGVGKNNL